MTNNKELIIQLKKVRDEKHLSFNDILDLMEVNGDYLSKSTLSRVFAEGSEDVTFRYDETIRPIANALLDIDNIEADDNDDVQALKRLVQQNEKLIAGLQQQITNMQLKSDEEKISEFEKMERERESWSRSIEFLKDQIIKKDDRIDKLLNAVQVKDEIINSLHDQLQELHDLILSCPARKIGECKEV